MGKVIPRIALRAIVLTHSAPLAFAEVRAPFAPETILRFVVLLLLEAEEFAVCGKIDSGHGGFCFFVHGGGLKNACDTKTMAGRLNVMQVPLWRRLTPFEPLAIPVLRAYT